MVHKINRQSNHEIFNVALYFRDIQGEVTIFPEYISSPLSFSLL